MKDGKITYLNTSKKYTSVDEGGTGNPVADFSDYQNREVDAIEYDDTYESDIQHAIQYTLEEGIRQFHRNTQLIINVNGLREDTLDIRAEMYTVACAVLDNVTDMEEQFGLELYDEDICEQIQKCLQPYEEKVAVLLEKMYEGAAII